MAQDCPKCGRVNPDTADRCDCGYDFSSRTMKVSYLIPRTSEGQRAARLTVAGIRYACFCIVWIGLYAITLELVAGIVRDRLLERASHDGYAAYVSLAGFLMIMPVALLFSLVILAVLRRWWLFLGLAPITALGTAIAPAVLG
jgi:hypothetical protein